MRVRLFTVDGDYVSTFAAHIDEVGTLLPPGGNGVVYAEDHYYLYSKFIRTLLGPGPLPQGGRSRAESCCSVPAAADGPGYSPVGGCSCPSMMPSTPWPSR